MKTTNNEQWTIRTSKEHDTRRVRQNTNVSVWVLLVVLGIAGTARAAIIDDTFDGPTIDTNLWAVTPTATTNAGSLTVNSGGAVRSKVTGAISNEGLAVTFWNEGTTDWNEQGMELGLYSADGTQNIRVSEPVFAYCAVYITNGANTFIDYLNRPSWGINGPELRNPGSQTWNITVTPAAVKIYVDAVLKATYNQGDTYYGDPLIIPTLPMEVGFSSNSTAGDFRTDRITLAMVPEPAMLSLLLLTAGAAGLRRRRS